MLKRWGISLATLAISAGGATAAPAALAGPATSAALATGTAHTTGTAQTTLAAGSALGSGGAQAADSAHAARYVAATRPGTPNIARGGSARQATSTNWSGYVAAGHAYASVSASWVQPPVSCDSDPEYSSFWVGLDGYTSKTVEQIGTDSDCSGGPHYYGWYEMYPSSSRNFSRAIGPGDTIRASVGHAGGDSYRLTLSDVTKKWSTTVTRSVPGAARDSAEVIVEAPSDSEGILPLAHFGATRVSGALVNGAAIGRQTPTRITMTNGAGAAKDTVSPLGGGESFRVTWQRSN
jgi:hypothetical protein